MSDSFPVPKNFGEPSKTKVVNFEKPLTGEELHSSKVLEETLPPEKVREIHVTLSERLEALNFFRTNLGLTQISLPKIVWENIETVACVEFSNSGSVLKLIQRGF